MHTCKAPVMRRSHRAYSPDTRRNIPFRRRILAGTVAGKVDGAGTAGRFGRPGSVMADGWLEGDGRWPIGGRWPIVHGRWSMDGGWLKRGDFHMCEKTAQGSREIPTHLYKGDLNYTQLHCMKHKRVLVILKIEESQGVAAFPWM